MSIFFFFSPGKKDMKKPEKRCKKTQKKKKKKLPTSLYSLATSTCISSAGLPLYLSWISLTRGCRACSEIVDAICFLVSGYVAALTRKVSKMIEKP